MITGGAGFLRGALARRLLEAGDVAVGGAAPEPLTELVLADLVPPARLTGDAWVSAVVGDLIEHPPELRRPDLVLHLAGVGSG